MLSRNTSHCYKVSTRWCLDHVWYSDTSAFPRTVQSLGAMPPSSCRCLPCLLPIASVLTRVGGRCQFLLLLGVCLARAGGETVGQASALAFSTTCSKYFNPDDCLSFFTSLSCFFLATNSSFITSTSHHSALDLLLCSPSASTSLVQSPQRCNNAAGSSSFLVGHSWPCSNGSHDGHVFLFISCSILHIDLPGYGSPSDCSHQHGLPGYDDHLLRHH